jgi:MFS family permease
MDRIGHRKLQFIGFAFMGLAFLLIGVIPGVTKSVAPFLILFGMSYFFANFGPNETTFVLSGEVYPVSQRTTGHGISAGIAKFGAFLGVFLFPIMSKDLGLSGVMVLVAVFSLLGILVTFAIPEPAQKSLEEVSMEDEVGIATNRISTNGHRPEAVGGQVLKVG